MIGGGRIGHIGVLMDAAVYANAATTDYVRPTEPGPYAQHGPGESAAAQADKNAIYKEGRRIYDLDNNVDAALKQEIIATVEETYLSIKNQHVWCNFFHNTSSCQDYQQQINPGRLPKN